MFTGLANRRRHGVALRSISPGGLDVMRRVAALGALFGAISVWPARADFPQIKHIVIVFQENRTPDNLFHGLNKELPAADIADSGVDSSGQEITLTPEHLANTYDLSHAHQAFELMYDLGKMDGADLIPCSAKSGTTCPTLPQFRYVDPADVAPYRFIAVHYGFANRMFQSNQGPSFPAHQFIIGGTSAPTPTSEWS
jgi:phospholipase C